MRARVRETGLVVRDRTVVAGTSEVAAFLRAADEQGRLLRFESPVPAGPGRVSVQVRLVEPKSAGRSVMSRPWLLAAVAVGTLVALALLGYAVVEVVAWVAAHWRTLLGGTAFLCVLAIWHLLGRSGACPGIHCPGCKCGR